MKSPYFTQLRPLLAALLVGRRWRRARLGLAVVALLSCATIRHVDEAQVRTIVAQSMYCDEQLVELESDDSPAEDVARYTARGCNQVRGFDCREHAKVVSCESNDRQVATNEVARPPSDTTIDTSSCDCGHFGHHHSGSPAASPATTSVMPSSQQTDNQRR